MRLLCAVAFSLVVACAPHPAHLSDPSPARVVGHGSGELTMEVQELI